MQCEQKYDIFISYRRATGANAARMMQLALTARGYSVFLDYDSLEDGKFNEAIYSAIDSCEVFILMMTEGALDRCMNPGDWVRLEIQRAIEQKKNIVPVAPSDQTWSFPDGLPRELSVLRNVHVSKLDMEELFNESIVKIETARFPKTVRARRRNVDRTDNGVKHAVGMREGGNAPLLLDDMRKRVMQRLADLQQLHDSIDEFRYCRERTSDWDSHIAHADDLWRKVCGIRTPTSIGEADKSLSRIGRSYAGVKDEVDWLRCQQEQERKQEKREQMLRWRLLEWWEESSLRDLLCDAFMGVGAMLLLYAVIEGRVGYVLYGLVLGMVSCWILAWWMTIWYYEIGKALRLFFATIVVALGVWWWIPKHQTVTVDGVRWEYDTCLWFAIVGDVWSQGVAVDSCAEAKVAVPDSMGGRQVVEIVDGAFQLCTNLTSILIPATVRNIGRNAFRGCDSLKWIEVGTWGRGLKYLSRDGLLYTRSGRMVYCPRAKTSVVLPPDITSIDDSAFSWCTGLTSMMIPPNVTSIGERAFEGCLNLTSLTISHGMTRIGKMAFHGCVGMTSVKLPSSMKSMEDKAFSECCKLAMVYVDAGDSERMKEMMAQAGANVDNIKFVEQ